MIAAVWEGSTLVADGTVDAAVTADGELTVDGQRITITHTAGALRWEVKGTSAGENFRIRMRGLGTGTLTARCGSRRYRAERNGTFSTTRSIFNDDGILVARTAPRKGTELHVELFDAAPLPDLAFITWALTYMDTSGRNVRI